MKAQTVLFRPLWPHQCSTDSEARIMATNEFVITPVASHLWAEIHQQETTMLCQSAQTTEVTVLAFSQGNGVPGSAQPR